MSAPRAVLAWWRRPVTWFAAGAVAIVVGVGLAFYTEFWMLLAAAPVFVALGIAAWIVIVTRVHRLARDGGGTSAQFEALLRDYLPFAAPTTLETLRERWRAATESRAARGTAATGSAPTGTAPAGRVDNS